MFWNYIDFNAKASASGRNGAGRAAYSGQPGCWQLASIGQKAPTNWQRRVGQQRGKLLTVDAT